MFFPYFLPFNGQCNTQRFVKHLYKNNAKQENYTMDPLCKELSYRIKLPRGIKLEKLMSNF